MVFIRFLRRHLLATIIIVSAVFVSATIIGILVFKQHADADKLRQTAAERSAQLDKKVAEAKKKAAAEAKAKAEAEAKAKAKAAAAAKKKAEAERKAKEALAVTCNPSSSHRNPAALDIIVNKKHCIQPLGFAPADLVTVYGATISAKAQANFVAMYQAAQTAGVPFQVTSSFRSYSNQVTTYNTWVAVNGQAGADTVSARPGYSEHQTGLSIDLAAASCALECFLKTPQYAWIQKHAAAYGWIQRYPEGFTSITGYSSEAWHYRYVGKAVAEDMKARGIKTLEQYWGISGGDY